MIAIHAKSGTFAPEWVAYCKEHGIPYKEVDCFSSDIVNQLRGCSALLWQWAHHDYHAQLFARQLIASIEEMGLEVFPSLKTCWHYDDKVGQKYLLEVVGAPVVPTYIFYDRARALQWLDETTFPKVWKLRGGAGSQNVRLVKTAQAARKLVNRSFGSGWKNSRFHSLKDRIGHFRRDPSMRAFFDIGRGIARAILPHEKNRKSAVQRDYVYFQDFVPDCDHDIRVVVVGNRCYAYLRGVREGDFRASGSGILNNDPGAIPIRCIEIAFDVVNKLKMQSAAFDFVSTGDEYLLVEMSYVFGLNGARMSSGYWDSSMKWHPAPVTPERFILEDMLAALPSESVQMNGVKG